MNRKQSAVLVCVLIAVATWLVFGQTAGHDFVNYDDGVYVSQNAFVRSGLTWNGALWAFTQPHARNWHPLTTMSHMLDVQLFGLEPAGHHLVNVLLHLTASLLLFFVLRRMTGSVWSSAFVAAVFAVHPLRVESVAWIAERKDVLSGVFFMLTLLAYVRYVRNATRGRYITMSILFACGLMSKPMLVTVPILLLLLDYWPLNRITDLRSFGRMVLEKAPLFAMALAAALVTFLIQKRSFGAIAPLPLAWRIENAAVSYILYLWQMIWPANLAVFYPHPENSRSAAEVAVAILLLISITSAVVAFRQTRPYLLVGWLWYMSMLAPVIGIVQVGLQGHADRYTYLPQIGLYLALTWLIVDLAAQVRFGRAILTATAVIVLTAFGVSAHQQVSYWRDSETLWTRTLAVTRNNDVAHTNLGIVRMERGQFDDAIAQFEMALRIHGNDPHPHHNLSRALTHTDLGDAFAHKGSSADAIGHYRSAIALEPNYADAHYNLGSVLLQRGDLNGAIAEWEATLSIQPDDAEAHASLGNALLQKGALREAVAHYEKAVAAPVPSVFAMNNLAWISATCPEASFRNGERAVALASSAVKMSQGKVPMFLRTFAAALAEAGRFDEAMAMAARAREAAHEDVDLAKEIERDVDLYRAHSPVRDSSLTTPR